PRGYFARGGSGVSILFGISTVAVAVFEIDPEVLHRFAAQLLDDPLVDDVAVFRVDADGIAERGRIRREFIERMESERAEFLRRVALEQMRAPVDGMHRLPRARLAGKTGHEFLERRIERRRGGAEVVVGKR